MTSQENTTGNKSFASVCKTDKKEVTKKLKSK